MRFRMAAAALAATLVFGACNDHAGPTTLPQSDATLRLQIVSGDKQYAQPGQKLAQPLVVQVMDSAGSPVQGQIVNFVVTSGGGSVFGGTNETDAQGIAQDIWTLGQSGTQTVQARAVDNTTGAPLVFGTFTAYLGAPTVSRLVVTPDTVQMSAVGQTSQLEAQASDQNGNPLTTTATWSSLAPSVASVSSSGLVTALAGGTARIVAAEGGAADTAVAIVTVAPSTSTVAAPTGLTVGAQAIDASSFQVTILWQAAAGATSYAWSSGTNNGGWSAKGTTTKTTATFTANNLTTANGYWVCVKSVSSSGTTSADQSCKSYSPPSPATSTGAVAKVTVSPSSAQLTAVGATTQLAAQAYDASGTELTGQSFTWTSSNTAVATVSSAGLVTARASGAASITATASGVSGQSAVTVTVGTSPPPSSGNPEPSAGDQIYFDYRSSLQQTSDETTALNLVSTDRSGPWHFTTNMDGAGTHALRVDWTKAASCTDEGTIMVMSQGISAAAPKRLYVQWKQWMGRTATGGGVGSVGAFSVTNPNCGNAARKMAMVLRSGVGGGSTDRIEYIWPGPAPALPAFTSDYLNYRVGLNQGIYWEGQQHINQVITYTIYYQAESSPGAGDGVLRLWINGQLLIEDTHAAIGAEGFDRWQFPTTFRAPLQDQSEYFWDMVAWTPAK